MTNKQIARYLKETAALIELTGGNPFRGRAFDRAARTLEREETSIAELLAENALIEIPGIGAGLAAQIRELLAYGSFEVRDELLSAIPPGLLDALRVKGLGAKKVRRLWKELGITTLDDLEHAAATGRLADLDGFGAKSQDNILTNVRLLKQYQLQRRYADALHEVDSLLPTLGDLPGVERIEITGALRRKLETVDAVDLLAATKDAATASLSLQDAAALEPAEAEMLTGTLPSGLPLRIHLCGPDEFGTAWWQRTGSDDFLTAFEVALGTPGRYADEAEVFSVARLSFIEPELREDADALTAAAENALPDLITVDDLHGSLHNHSTYSDGTHTLRQMAEFARSMGLSYFGICDHSQSLKVANGMPAERVVQQQEEIRALNTEYAADGGAPFRIFSGIESDILADGSLDYPEDVLASFDFIVASVHTRFNMTEAEATDRVIRAVSNPYTRILGHPTGRLLLTREGYPLDHEAVITACAEHGVAIELNANPYRLDLDWRWIRTATRQGVLISINPDAHAMEQLPYVRWGIAAARKGWLTAAQCLNAKSLDDFTLWLS